MKPQTWKEKRKHMVKCHISLEAVYCYVKNAEYPPGTNDLDKRSIRKRAKSFDILDNHFVYIPEKSQKILDDGTEINIEPRRVLLKDEKRRKAVWEAHVDEQGTHVGMEKTTTAVSKKYYWMGISSLVREIIRDCAVCRASKAACGTTVTMQILSSEIKSEADVGTVDEEYEPVVPFHSMGVENATCFWQKVELQILGPFDQVKSKMYVVVCLDRYSFWTEGAVIPAISSATITHVILNLICRFGNMQSLMLRENEKANRNNVEIREDLFAKAGFDIKLTVDNSSETANMWKNIEQQVTKFTEHYPTCWSQCLDLCLLPLRISRPDMMEYTPDFLVYNREMSLPACLSHRPENFDIELHLSEQQMTESTKLLMNIYDGFCLSFPYYIPKLTLARQTPKSTAVSKTNVTVIPAGARLVTTNGLTGTPVTVVPAALIKPVTAATPPAAAATTIVTATTAAATSVVSSIPVTVSVQVPTSMSSTSTSSSSSSPQVKLVTSDKSQTISKTQANSKSSRNEQMSPRKIVTRSGRVSVPTPKPGMVSLLSSSTLLSEKDTQNKDSSESVDGGGGPDEEYVPPNKKACSGKALKEKKSLMTSDEKKSSPVVSSSKEDSTSKKDKKKIRSLYQETISFDTPEKMEDLDVYYAALKQYILLGTYMPGSTVYQKRVIRKISKNYVVENDVMYYIYDNKRKNSKKMVVMTLSERIDLLRAAHVLKDGTHVCKQKVVDTLDQQKKYWKGLTLDAYAFTRACRTCDHGRERLRDYSQLKDEEEDDDDEEDDDEDDTSEEDMQEDSYEDLMTYIKHRRYPKGMLANQKSTIRKRSKKFTFIDKELYYVYSKSSDVPPRKVLLTEQERTAAIKQAHSDNHWGINKTMLNVREIGYWSGITLDCYNYLKNCKKCSRRLVAASFQDELKKKKQRIEERVKRFQELFVAKIMEMDKKAAEKSNKSPIVSVKVETDSDNHDLTEQFSNTLQTQTESDTTHDKTSQSQHLLPSAEQIHTSDKVATVSSGKTSQSYSLLSGNIEHTYSVGQKSGSDTLTLSVIPSKSVEQTIQSVNQIIPTDANKPVQTVQIATESDNRQYAVIKNVDAAMLPSVPVIHPLKLEDGIEITVTYADDFIPDVEDRGNADQGTSGNQVIMFEDQSNAEEDTTETVHLQDIMDLKSSKKQKFKCEYCGKVIKGTITFKYHIFKHTGVKPFQCEICPKKFTNNKSCRLHMRKHTGELPYLCNLCGKGFGRAASLQYHLKAHSEGGGFPVECEICHRIFTTATRLRKHMICKHPERPPVYECHQCNKVFTASRSLKRHQTSHQGIRQYQCQFCGRGFFRKEYLNSHMLQHPEAGSLAPSKAKSQRKKSLMTLTFENPDLDQGSQVQEDQQYQCQYCGQVFLNKDYLSTHLLQHPETGSIVVVTSDPNGEPKKTSMQLQFDGQGFDHESDVGHPDMNELQRQQVEDAAQEQAIQSIVQIEQPPQESTSFVLSQDAVEYEVECFTSESLTEADLKAIQILTQASLHGPL